MTLCFSVFSFLEMHLDILYCPLLTQWYLKRKFKSFFIFLVILIMEYAC